MKKTRFAVSSALCSAAFVAIVAGASPAFAQDQETPAPATAALPEEAEEKADSEEMVITGSRIRRTEFNSPDPITIIDPEIAQAAGRFSTADMLQSAPVANGSNQITSAISANFVTNGGPGANTLSLRGLGANRTLILLNSRRAGPAGTRGGVSSFDLNVLPQSIIKNVEILKTGASSVYGSDAVAGVVNLTTKTDTNGLELTAFANVTEESGGEQYRIAATWGKDWGNGHILIAGDYFRSEELKRRDREYLDCAEDYLFVASGGQPTSQRADIIDPRTGNPRCNGAAWGHNWVYDASFRQVGRWQYDYDGSLARILGNNQNGNPINFPTQAGFSPNSSFVVPNGFYRVSYTNRPNGTIAGPNLVRLAASVDNLYHPFQSASTVNPPQNLYTAYVDAAYNVTDSIEVGVELLFNRRETTVDSFAQFYYLTGYTNNQFGTGFGDPYIPGWTGRYYVSPTPITDHADQRLKVDYYRAVAFARGDWGIGDWNWDIWGQYSRSDGDYQSDVIFNDAINVFNYRTGNQIGTVTPVSNRTLTTNINWLDPRFLYGDLNQAERDFLYGEDFGNTLYTQWIAEASTSGKLFDLPAGPFQAALGVTWRRDEITDTPGFHQQRDNNFVASAAGVTSGYTITKEAFAEVDIPLIFNTPLIQQFTLSASGRVTNVDYQRTVGARESDSTNGNWTYSIGANWEVTDWLRIRARYGTSFRAPALFELFLADESSGLQNRSADPCVQHLANATAPGASALAQRISANCEAGIPALGIPGVPGNILTGGGIQGTVFTGGGITTGLEPESSTAKTAGVVLTPKFDFLPDTKINIAVDYFDINIKGEIAALSAGQILQGCYASENFGPNELLCRQFNRRAPGTSTQLAVNQVFAQFINISEQRNEGVDVTVQLNQDLGKLGTLTVLGQMTWQMRDEIQVIPGVLQDNNGEAGDPIWVGDFNIIWSPTKKTRIFYGIEAVGATDDTADYTRLTTNGSICQVGSVLYGDYCVDVTTDAQFYHSLSVSQEIGDKFELSLGINNIFNTRPPRTTVSPNTLNNGAVPTLGQSVFTSQYDLLGRRFFVNVSAKF